jgi:dTDP-4-amino-4,6-dideoxygalactose transaminase
MMKRPILIAASPNTQSDDVALAFKGIFQPWKWYDPSSTNELESRLSLDFNSEAITFDSARSAFYSYLKALELEPESEVILPAFSCMVVANAVLWAGLKPVFVDCNKLDYNYDLSDLEKKLTQRTKVVVLQHSFGFPENVEKIRSIVGEGVLIMEDLAHSLGGNSEEGKLGTLGDAAILTFGIEKVISGVRGGMLLIRDEKLAAKIREMRNKLPRFPFLKTFSSLLNPLLWEIIIPTYNLGIAKFTLGRMLTAVFHAMGLLGNMIEPCEYNACKPNWLPSPISPILAKLALNQYEKLDLLNKHRREIAAIYQQELGIEKLRPNDVYLRFPLVVHDRCEVTAITKAEGIVLGDWYKSILYAPQKSLQGLGYLEGSCPNAEALAQKIVNLPTHIRLSFEQAKMIAKLVKPYIS